MVKKRIILLMLMLVSSFSNGNLAEKEGVMQNPHSVIVILEAKKGKEGILKEELLKIMELSRLESTCLDYRVHQDLDNPAQFVLYEDWTSKEDHAKQFQKPYIIDFGNKLEDLLSKPYQCVIAKRL